MLPVTRANLDHICCICLLDIRQAVFTQKVYDVRETPSISKVLKLTAHITILKNPINQKYINEYCRKICETCFIKVQYSYVLREKIIASTTTIKELLENNNLEKIDVERLQFFCRICLNRQTDINDTKRLDTVQLNWMKDCSGIRYTSFVDTEAFRIKDGTNINEIAIINDTEFPQHLCRCCFKKLKNVYEFRKSATHSFEYMISVMDDAIVQEEYFQCPKILNKNQTESLLLNCKKFDEPHLEVMISNVFFDKPNNTSDVKPVLNVEDFVNMDQFENSMDNLCRYSDSSEEGNFSNYDKNLGKSRIKKSEQVQINEIILKNKEEHSKTDIYGKSKSPSKLKLPYYPQMQSGLRNLKENKETTKVDKNTSTDANNDKTTFVCEECSKEFTSKRSLRKHKGLVHNFDSSKMLECKTCFKKFKRKSHINAHIKTVHEKQKPFKCTYCAKTFTAKSTKRVHELSHTGDYPFMCNFCKKGFRRSNQLKIHLDIHTTIPELLCPICKRSQKSKTDLENHLKKHSDKRVQCPLCGKFFTRNFHLIDHQNAVHLKLRPFKCEFCELAFGDRKTRRTHEKSHTEDRPFKCSICLMGFKSKINLSRHIKENGHNT